MSPAAKAIIAAALARHERMTARQIIEARLGRPIGQLTDMPRDTRTAIYLLAKQLAKINMEQQT